MIVFCDVILGIKSELVTVLVETVGWLVNGGGEFETIVFGGLIKLVKVVGD